MWRNWWRYLSHPFGCLRKNAIHPNAKRAGDDPALSIDRKFAAYSLPSLRCHQPRRTGSDVTTPASAEASPSA
jgi:hypothetical protein